MLFDGDENEIKILYPLYINIDIKINSFFKDVIIKCVPTSFNFIVIPTLEHLIILKNK